jgi:enterochelin esterase family protein
MRGTLLIESFHSRCLEGNPLGDPATRNIPVYLPEGYAKTRDYPLYIFLSGFSGCGRSLVNWTAWNESLPERVERLISEAAVPPCVVVMPDCFTKYGGSQYINSSATGDYEDHITGELIPWIRDKFNAGLRPETTALAGKSSGGYGAFVLAARHPELFGYIINHSGDSYFDYSYQSEFGLALNELRKHGGPQNFLKTVLDQRPKGRTWFACIETLAMASCYSPNPAAPLGFDFPFDLETGERRDDVWARWLVHDPVRMAERDDIQANLKQLKGIYIECGLADEWYLNWGARILVKRLRDARINVEHVEFEDGHMNIQYRYDFGLKWWGKLLSS